MKKITLLMLLSFTILGFSQDKQGKIRNYINANKAKFELSTQDLQELFIESELSSESTGITSCFVKQKYQGTELRNSSSNFWIKNNEVINGGQGFIINIASKVNTTTPSLSVMQALSKANTLLDIETPQDQKIIETIDSKNFRISNENQNVITAKLVYQLTNDQNLNLAWDFTIEVKGGNHMWNVTIDAVSGKIIESHDMVISCAFGPNHNHAFDGGQKISEFDNSFFKNSQASMLNVNGGSYTVVPYNYESPNHSARIAIASPENAAASPKGWHDTNILTGNSAFQKYTSLRGNNAWARADYGNSNPTSTQNANSQADGYSPVNAGLIFDYPYGGTSVGAKTYIDAAMTNLFYMNNIMHDVWFQYGFNEANGNFQKTNYTISGSGNDFVWADAQDASTAATPAFNNANFSTPVDGNSGRMQMYLWTVSPPLQPLFINSPSDIAGPRAGNDNAFNPGHVALPVSPALIQSDLVLYDDGTPDPGETDNADGCAPAVNAAAISGHIAVIRRSLAEALGGTPCPFAEKVKNAQNAGATAVIIVNNVDPSPTVSGSISMSGADATITIPAISVTKAIGYPLIARIKTGIVNGKLQVDGAPFVNADGDFDNGIIAHEFGHGISNRLSGGPLNSSCLQNAEQMGEGWSDWFALMMQIKTGDVGTTAKTVGTFAVSQPTTGAGIRNFPYSTDMNINPLTFVDSNDDESHNRGEFMTVVLWDLTWAYINKYGFNSDIYAGNGGNNKVMRLVIDALKLQPCSPTFVEYRDALLAADQATTSGADNCLIKEVFRKRGMGLNASSGLRTNALDQVEDFTAFAPGPNCTLGINYFNEDMFSVYPNPTNGNLNIRINNFSGKVNIQVIDINGRIVNDYRNTDLNEETSLDLNNLQSGMYIIKVSGDNVNYTKKIIKN